MYYLIVVRNEGEIAGVHGVLYSSEVWQMSYYGMSKNKIFSVTLFNFF